MGQSGTRNPIFGFPESAKKIGLMQVEQGFSSLSLLPIFDAYSKFHSNFGMLHFKKSSNMAKIKLKMKKSLLQLAFNPFLHGTTGTPGHTRSATTFSINFGFYLDLHERTRRTT